MAFTLNYLQDINLRNELEHRQWVEAQLAFVPKHIFNAANYPRASFSILKQPKLWSGSRFFQTTVNANIVDQNQPVEVAAKPFKDLVKDVISTSKKHFRQDAGKLAKLKQFSEDYELYRAMLTERSLLQAILRSCEFIGNQAGNNLRNLFTKGFALKLKTRSDCLALHAMIVTLSRRTQSLHLTTNQRIAAKQAEVLGKRLVDIHYDRVKKTSLIERTINGFSTSTSIVGLVAGIAGAVLAIAGLFVPPLLLPAGILGTISFMSYASTVISAGKIAYEGLGYKRSPSAKEMLILAVDIVLAPLNLIGGTIFSSIKALKSVGSAAKLAISKISLGWNYIVSNVFPDIFYSKDMFDDIKSYSLPTKSKLEHTTSALNWKNITSHLLADYSAEEVLSIKQNTKKQIKNNSNVHTEINSSIATEKYSRDFSYLRLPTTGRDKIPEPNKSHLQNVRSFHAQILTWDEGLYITKSLEKIKKAETNYTKLDADVDNHKRLEKLALIRFECTKYFALAKSEKDSARYKAVLKLDLNTKKEAEILKDVDNVVLIGHKAP